MGFNRKLVTSIIANAQQFEWTLQGLGMFRTYIPFCKHCGHIVCREFVSV